MRVPPKAFQQDLSPLPAFPAFPQPPRGFPAARENKRRCFLLSLPPAQPRLSGSNPPRPPPLHSQFSSHLRSGRKETNLFFFFFKLKNKSASGRWWHCWGRRDGDAPTAEPGSGWSQGNPRGFTSLSPRTTPTSAHSYSLFHRALTNRLCYFCAKKKKKININISDGCAGESSALREPGGEAGGGRKALKNYSGN